MVNVLIATASSAGGGVPNTEPQIPLAASDGPDEHAATPIPRAPTKATPASIRPNNPPLPMAISRHTGHPPGSGGRFVPTPHPGGRGYPAGPLPAPLLRVLRWCTASIGQGQ